MKNIRLFLLGLCAVTMLNSCALGKAALNAPGLLFKGMNEAVRRTVGLGASNDTLDRPVIDSESLRQHRQLLEEMHGAPLPEDKTNAPKMEEGLAVAD